ncbi:competence protein CoiA family protein [Zhouia amylolytica]|uniref:competence protein CoiA family protein n=1 Tax=Zhouia amylolytica TaxID=376730 RepID=UPI0020CF8109|nr:competence protein CoiA family protein [Zhouia amylolytica]MCQ0110303.1 hypothetical protein [Zhouia amylolytica]
MNVKLPFGLKDGEIIHISEVEKGLQSGCICPSCKVPLIARKGDNNIHHFAHHNEPSCEKGYETAIHLAAKKIVKENRKIIIPSLKEFISVPMGSKYICLVEEQEIGFDVVEEEKSVGPFIPDLIALKGKKQLFIEIAVTHFIDDVKKEKIIEYGVSTIEVDLSDLKEGFSLDELRDIVLIDTSNKKWVFNSKKEELEKECKIKLANELKSLSAEIECINCEEESIEDSYLLNARLVSDKEDEIEIKRVQKILDEAKKNRYRIIEIGSFFSMSDDKFKPHVLCPKKMKKVSFNFKHNNVINMLRNGGNWNGVIYGYPGSGQKIYINNKEIEIFPKDKEFNLTEYEHKKRRQLYGQLNRIESLSKVPLDECKKCAFCKAITSEESYGRVVCTYI